MRGNRTVATSALVAVLLFGCARRTSSMPPSADASGSVELSVRVPAALAVARAIDTLSVTVDPASLGLMQVTTHAGTTLGVEANISVFSEGRPQPVLERRCVVPGADFAACSDTWDTKRDGVPAPGAKYVVEMRLVLFETSVPASREWDAQAGHLENLWTRTLRQAEE
jgi:hypothetical protein